MPEQRQPMPGATAGGYAAAGLLGGLVAIVLAAIGLATGLVDGHTTRVVDPAPGFGAAGGGGAHGLSPREIDARSSPGVAQIRAFGVPSDTPLGPARGVEVGSGVVLDRQGRVLTNAHVIHGADRVTVQLDSGSGVPAKVIGEDDSNDLAVLQVDPDDVELHPLPLGESDDVQVGDPVVAIGNPLGLDRTATAGIVSGIGRTIHGPNGVAIQDVIQTDASINPGNSGGPLIDARGRVIGINAQVATTPGGGETNIGFAIPIDTAKDELARLERGD